MKLTKSFAALALSLSVCSFALADIIKDRTHFDTVGTVDTFRWAPERYQNDFQYDIFYYIPKSIELNSKVPALIFNHGGGGSTMDRAGSVRTVNMYMPDLKRMADELGIVVVLPSANGLNWGGHTRGLMRDLSQKIAKDLDVDIDRIGLSGHSMGGMGITRNYLWNADNFAFFLPMAAGMDVNHQSEQHLNKVFNVPYVHLQGKFDHFEVFITRCEEQLKRTRELEQKYNLPSMLDIVFYNGSHNYDFGLFKTKLNNLITKSPRNLYQKELRGSLHTVKKKNIENNIEYDYDSEARYFWVEAIDTDYTTPERIDFHAKIEGQTISLEMEKTPVMSKGLRLYLHPSMINLKKKITVMLNGEVVAVRKAGLLKKITRTEVVNMDSNDPGFNFAETIDLNF